MSIKVFYNDVDQSKCAWMSNLMDAGLIRPGIISDKSITNLTPQMLEGYELAHFFAGIAGWDYAFTLAGWQPDGAVTWTGSVPCQPFSTAGRGKAQADARHLWPAWFRLIRECRPSRVFGEQVAAAVGWGWLDGISTDLEAAGYAVGATVLGAHSLGAPHIRQRLYWVADSDSSRHDRAHEAPEAVLDGLRSHDGLSERDGGTRDGLAYGPQERRGQGSQDGRGGVSGGAQTWQRARSANDGVVGRLGNAPSERCGEAGPDSVRPPQRPAGSGCLARQVFWDDYAIVHFTDGKARRVKPGIECLAARLPGDLGRLRGYGDSIVPQVAAEFVSAYLATRATGAGERAP